ncbi:MAG TPA: outer membrane protein assembly factor BamC [Albitalea sp.]|uniref:outer membrane protein assembly factor BamC n=1 Tax=Piscinibacter sp. TaxID=1903157 RepID=UPI002ED658E1
MENFLGGDKIDYRSAGATREKSLEVPPDLSQLGRDTRFQAAPGGSVSAAQYQAGAAATAAVSTSNVAPKATGDIRMEREGNQRWLAVPMPPEQLWPQLQAFWKERGFNLLVDQSDAGVMETDWAENRAKLPQDIIRNTIGKVLDSLYSTGERDKFRTRVERTANGSEIYLSHRGLIEVYSGDRKETTVWQPRPADPQLEAEMLQRIMLKLGVKEEQAKATVATGGTPVATRARIVEGQSGATLQVDDGFDRAWRRVGLALDRSGFTVEDRDRAQGLYFVRYVDPSQAGKDEPGLLSRLFSFGKKDPASGPARYRVQVKGEGDRSTVTVLNNQGQPENGEAGKRIVSLLVEDLK